MIRPDYAYLRRTLKDLFFREAFQYDFVFDWTILNYESKLRSFCFLFNLVELCVIVHQDRSKVHKVRLGGRIRVSRLKRLVKRSKPDVAE